MQGSLTERNRTLLRHTWRVIVNDEDNQMVGKKNVGSTYPGDAIATPEKARGGADPWSPRTGGDPTAQRRTRQYKVRQQSARRWCGQRDRGCQGVWAVCDRRLKEARLSRDFRWSELGLKSQSHQQHYGGSHGAFRRIQ